MNNNLFRTNEEFSEWIQNHSDSKRLRLYQFLKNEMKSKTETAYGRMNAVIDCVVLLQYLLQSNSKSTLLDWEKSYRKILKMGERLVLKRDLSTDKINLLWENVNEVK